MVERAARDDGVERARLVELLERNATEDESLGRLGIDRGDDVAGGREQPSQVALAAADLDHTRRRRREV